MMNTRLVNTPPALTFRWLGMNGTEGTHDLERAEGDILPRYEELLLDALQRDTLEYIERVLA